jgi:excisionase family DNA binding protein
MNRETRKWLKVPEVAEELGIPRSRAYELIQHGELPAVRIGERSIRVNRRELERFLLETRQIVASQTERPHSGPKTRGERF